ncbi:DoxX family protein [Terrimonas sp. NA20]|uniref:DoxX family protein n=1 Tax=Terrimonas ginsenosidimutans TaxID=2908004 RepID=A0ABS9KU53_9BACT|nr:DoxX family protein [Terrimonas ginsenosidimutans]MCG2615836.1 DoxX family protein [Terrimonas ginsenosidimutans]
MKRIFPFVSASVMQPVLRCSLALVFFLHAAVRIANHTIPQFAGFLENAGLPFGKAIVIAISVFEIAGAVLLAMGVWVRLISAGLFVLLLIGIILIHWANGWFVGEHGVGGIEYSFVLMVGLMVVAAGARETTNRR